MANDLILVTGGAGFIGAHLARRLVADGRRVLVVDNLATGYRRNVPAGAEFIEADIADAAALDRLPWAEIDSVLHLAAQSSGEVSREQPALDLEVNVRGTFLLLERALRHGVKRFLYAGSMAAYGDQPAEQVDETTTLQPLSFYGISKKCAEEYVRWFQEHGLSTTVFRMFSVYGPGQNLANMKQGMVSIFLKFLLDGQPVHVKGSGDRFRDFIHIDDVASAWLTALDHPAADGRTYNLASGRKTLVRELVAALLQAAGKADGYPVRYEGSTPDDQRGLYANVDRLRNELGWEPKVDLAAGLADMYTKVSHGTD